MSGAVRSCASAWSSIECASVRYLVSCSRMVSATRAQYPIRGLLLLERPHVEIRDGPVADALVDRVGGRVREVGEEEAEAPPALEDHPRQPCREGARVAASPQLRRCVDRADADAGR